MTQQEFNNLSKRYLEGKATEEETTYLMDWYRRQPLSTESNLTPEQKNALEKRMWKRIHNQMPITRHVVMVRMAWISGIAACLSLCFWWVNAETSPITKEPLALRQVPGQVGIEVKNTAPSEQQVKLEDGTVLLLKQNSSILYDKSFNKTKREVYLKGEAFFKVKRDVTKPFVVHTGDLITEVLGTSFRIKAQAKANEIEVTVATGRVSVYTEIPHRRAERNGVILTPNQRVTFDTRSKNIIPSIVDAPVPIPSAETVAQPLIFQNTSLEEVLQALSQLYGIEFVIANPKAKNCRITADLKGLSMFTQLDLICKSIDATYQKRGTVVFISSDGC